MPESIKKRDGRLVPYDEAKIASAIDRAFVAAESGKGADEAERLAKIVTREMNAKESNETPSVEDIQDQVEQVLIAEGYAKTAKAYILYGDYQQTVPHFLFVESGSNVQLISHAKSQILLSPADAFLQSGNHQIRFQTVLCFCV